MWAGSHYIKRDAKWICPLKHVNRTQFYRCATCFFCANYSVSISKLWHGPREVRKKNTTPWNAYDFVWYKVQSKAQVKWIWCAGLLAHGIDLKSTLNQSIFIVVTAIAHQKSQLEFYQSWHFFQWLRLAYGKMRLDPANSDTVRCDSQYFQMMKKGNKTNWHP